jgi:localization factor PodJL
MQPARKQMQQPGTAANDIQNRRRTVSAHHSNLNTTPPMNPNPATRVSPSDESNARALRSLQARLAQMSAKAANDQTPAVQAGAQTMTDIQRRIGDLTRRIEQAERNVPDAAAIHSAEQRLAQLSGAIPAAPPQMPVEPAAPSQMQPAAHAPAAPPPAAATAMPAPPAPSSGKDPAIAQLEGTVLHLGGMIQELRSAQGHNPALDALKSQVAALTGLIGDARPAENAQSIAQLESQIGGLAQRVELALGQNQITPQITELGQRVHALENALQAVQSQTPDGQLVAGFEQQLNELGQRLGHTEKNYSALQTIEHSIAQLFDAVETNRNWMQQTAQQMEARAQAAATPAANTADQANTDAALSALDAQLKSREQQSQNAFASINATLETLLKRLSDLEARRGAPATVAEPQTPIPQNTSPAPANPQPAATSAPVVPQPDDIEKLSNLLAGRPETVSAPAPTEPNAATATDQPLPASDASAPNEDFIAAARRIAQTQEPVPEPEKKSPFDFLARSMKRDHGAKQAHNATQAGPSGKTAPGEPAPAARKRKPLLIAATLLLAIGAVAAYGYTSGFQFATSKAPPAKVNPQPGVKKKLPASGPKTQAPKPTPKPVKSGAAPATSNIAQAPPMTPPAANPTRGGTGGGNGVKIQQVTPAPDGRIAPPGGPKQFSLLSPHGDWAVNQPHANTPAGVADPLVTGSVPPRPAANAVKPQPRSRAAGPLPPAAIGSNSLRRAAAGGDPAAQYEIAVRYSEGNHVPQDYRKAAAWYQKAAAQGLAPAQYRLGTFYEKGRGVPLDKAAARIWYERAAEKGNRKAMHNLAVIYANGGAGRPDFAKAALWFRKAAELGLTDSQFNLAILNERGLGTPKDPAEAYRWFAIAARGGDKEAVNRQLKLEQSMAPQLLVKAKLAAQTWDATPMVGRANKVKTPPGGWDKVSRTAPPAPPSRQQMIAEAQALLNRIGLKAGPADGVMGQQTRDAIRAFQTQNGMVASGDVDAQLIEKLRAIGG